MLPKPTLIKDALTAVKGGYLAAKKKGDLPLFRRASICSKIRCHEEALKNPIRRSSRPSHSKKIQCEDSVESLD